MTDQEHMAMQEAGSERVGELEPDTELTQLREALDAIHTAWNEKPHHDDIGGFNWWYSAHIDLVEAALAPRGAESTKE